MWNILAAAWHFLASASKERANALAFSDFDSVLCRKGPTEQKESEITIVKSPLVPSLAVVIPFREQIWRNLVGLGMQRWPNALGRKGNPMLDILDLTRMARIGTSSSMLEQDKHLGKYAPNRHAAHGSERMSQPRRYNAKPRQASPQSDT